MVPTLAYVILALLTYTASIAVASTTHGIYSVVAIILGSILYAIQCGMLARHKGRSVAWAAAAFLGCAGIIIIAFLPKLRPAALKNLELLPACPWCKALASPSSDLSRSLIRIDCRCGGMGIGTWEHEAVRIPSEAARIFGKTLERWENGVFECGGACKLGEVVIIWYRLVRPNGEAGLSP